jgi:serine phosphatase RsbU (regulator of sigma subunit)/ligand-binding sensor domain-containing protein
MNCRLLLRCFILVTWFIGFTRHAAAQETNENGFFDIRNYTSKDYHLVPQNLAIVQDKRGLLYFGNNSGILEYDGRNWDTILTPKEAPVHSLAISSNGTIFVGGTGEIGYLSPNAIGKLKYISLLESLPLKDRDFEEIWKCFVTDDGNVYFQASNKIFCWNGKNMHVCNAKTAFHLMFYLHHTVYVREKEVGLFTLRDTSLTLIQGGELFAQEKIYFMLPFRKDRILLNTQDHGLFVMKPGIAGNQTSQLQTPEQLTKVIPFHTRIDEFFINNKVYNCIPLNKWSFSVGTLGNGIAVIDSSGNLMEALNKGAGLQDASIHSQFLDMQQKLWLATNNGITKVDINSPITRFNDQNGLEGTVQSMTRHEDKLYAATNTGIYCLQEPGVSTNPSQIEQAHFQKVEGIASECWTLLDFQAGKKSSLLVASNDGVYELTGNKISRVTKENENASMLFRSRKDSNRVFIGFTAGLSSIYWSNGSWVDEGKVLGVTEYIRSMDEAEDGTIWFGNNTTGVTSLLYGGGSRQMNNVKITRYGLGSGLPDEMVKVRNIGSKMYFATLRGLFKFDGKRFSADASLGSQFADGQAGPFRISEDSNGNIWIVKVYQKDGQMEVGYVDRHSPTRMEWVKTPFMGISKSITLSVFHDKDGITWLGGPDGIFRYNNRISKNYHQDYQALVRKVILGKDSVIFSGTNFNDSGFVSLSQPEKLKPRLHYSFNSFTFHFAAPDFEDETATLYSYMLEGFDKQWSGWKNESKAVYTNLPEGKYFFRVKAMNMYGHESQEAVYEFTILAPWYRTLWAYIGYVLFFFGFVYGAIIISTRGLRNIIQERTAEVVKQKEVIELKNKDITDSINYAKRIQEAILPTKENFKTLFPESFILYKPKDIVSGDFYWLSEKNDKIFFAAADCTGHGVPGAFTSMIGNSLLNEIVNDKGIAEPAKILDALREGIIKALKQSGKEGENKDGMDISLCCVDLKNKTLEYAGAYNPLFLVRKNELIEIKADKFPIGISDRISQFTNNLMNLEPGDSIYVFSDGYADQFGGSDGKKFMRKRFKELLLSVQSLSMDEQGHDLNKAIVSWQGAADQVDDILVIGVKI